MSDERARKEIIDGKKFSEDTLGHEVVAFCYPGGKFNRRIEKHVEEAGFLAGRTCRYFLNDYPSNPFSWDISTYANTYPAYVQVRHCLLECNFAGAYKYLTTFKARVPWVEQFICALEDVSLNGGMAHLYFHSWEIDQNGEWDRLESLFKVISQYSLTPVTNGFLFRRWHEKRRWAGSPKLVSLQPPA
jgi:peptidoglycan/xylan/chitin deacetylase (PgdA/CDA1 family)